MKSRKDHIRRKTRQRQRETRKGHRADARELARLLRIRKATR